MKKKIFVLFLLVLISFISFKVYNKVSEKDKSKLSLSKNKKKESITSIEVEKISTQNIKDERVYTGSVMAKSELKISSKVAGRIEKLFFDTGDIVKNGQLVAVIEKREFQNQIDQIQADLKLSEAQLQEVLVNINSIKRDLKRNKVLLDKKIISQAEFDDINTQLESSVSKQKIIEAQKDHKKTLLDLAKLKLSYTDIYAIWDPKVKSRIIDQKLFEEGMIINSNDNLFILSEFSNILVRISVPEIEYAKFKTNQYVEIKSDVYPDKIFKGKVYRKSTKINESSRNAFIDIEVNNSDNLLKPGMFNKVIVKFQVKNNVKSIPIKSLVKKDKNEGFFLVKKDKTVTFIVPKIGLRSDKYAEIISPENLSGEVVTLGYHLLKEGSKVSISKNNR